MYIHLELNVTSIAANFISNQENKDEKKSINRTNGNIDLTWKANPFLGICMRHGQEPNIHRNLHFFYSFAFVYAWQTKFRSNIHFSMNNASLTYMGKTLFGVSFLQFKQNDLMRSKNTL